MDHHPGTPDGQEKHMLWPASINVQRLVACNEAVTTCARQSGLPARSTMNGESRRWRG
jgi:hypothetical protein